MHMNEFLLAVNYLSWLSGGPTGPLTAWKVLDRLVGNRSEYKWTEASRHTKVAFKVTQRHPLWQLQCIERGLSPWMMTYLDYVGVTLTHRPP